MKKILLILLAVILVAYGALSAVLVWLFHGVGSV